MYTIPTLNPDNELEYSWAKWFIETEQLYRQGKLKEDQQKLFEKIAKKYNVELRPPPSFDIFSSQCEQFCKFVESNQTK